MRSIDAAFVKQAIPKRKNSAHKGSFGTLTVVAGSSQYRGAAALACAAALRAGVGILRLASTEKVCACVAAQQPCCTFYPLAENEYGGIAAQNAGALLELSSTAVLAGCGMGNTKDTAQLVEALLQSSTAPLLLDADALNTLAGHLDEGEDEAVRKTLLTALQNAACPVVLTPHIGEMARLSRLSAAAVQKNQNPVALAFAMEYGCTVVLKSYDTVVTPPNGEPCLLTMGGNPGLAKGGSGDVLAGITASLLAQGIDPPSAAAAAIWLHARAGQIAAEQGSFAGLSPAQLPEALCRVWLELSR